MKKIFNKIKNLISFKKLINNEELAYNFNEKFSLILSYIFTEKLNETKNHFFYFGL